MTQLNRRCFIQSAAAVAAAGTVAQAKSGKHIGGDRPLLKPVHEDIVCKWTPGNPRHDHQLIFALDDKRHMLVWSEYYADRPSLVRRTPKDRTGAAHDGMPCRISAKITDDAGRTWSDPFILQENLWRKNVKHPNLIRLSEKDLIFTCTGWDSGPSRNVYCKRSSDNGERWTEVERISKDGHYCNNAGFAFRMSTGRIILPAHAPGGGGEFDDKGPGHRQVGTKNLHAFMYYSDDGGKTWQTSADTMTAKGRGCHEPNIIERKDGSLLAFLRNTNQRIYRSVSEDAGVHWSKPEPTDLPAPEAPSIMRRMPTGDILLLWNNVASKSNWPRTPLTAAISTDEGKTWGHFKDIDNRSGHDAAYPDVAFIGDEAVVTYYTRPTNWARDSEIALKVYNVKQFY